MIQHSLLYMSQSSENLINLQTSSERFCRQSRKCALKSQQDVEDMKVIRQNDGGTALVHSKKVLGSPALDVSQSTGQLLLYVC